MTITRYIVSDAIAPMYKEQSTEAELSDEVLHGMEVEAISESENWIEARTHYHYTGFIEKRRLNCKEENIKRYRTAVDSPASSGGAADKFTVIGSSADVLSIPKVQGQILLCLPRGATVIKTDWRNDDNWCGVITADGREAFMRERLLKEYREPSDCNPAQEDFMRKSLIDTALDYMHTQYRWGGKTPFGIDCSGLTSMAYLLNGIIIYRDASIRDISEGYAMRRVPCGDNQGFLQPELCLSHIKPGDLIFFTGHVAMYIGDGFYIHSSPINEGVGINSLIESDPLYHADLAGKITMIGTVFGSVEKTG